MTQKERENFYRFLTLIVDHTQESYTGLLDHGLKKQRLTLFQLIQAKQHEIYHLCYIKIPCCMCSPRSKVLLPNSRIIHPPQLDILLDTTSRLPGHKQYSRTQHCCCPANPNISYAQLDSTLTRCLLVNCTTIIPDGSPERNAVEELTKLRNEIYAHAKNAFISDHDYQIFKSQVEKCIMVIAKVQGREAEFKQKLIDAAIRPLDETILIQYQTTLMANVEVMQKLKNIESAVEVKCLPDCLTKDLSDVTVNEGCDAHFEIWTKNDDLCLIWLKDGLELVNSVKVVIQTFDRVHKLTIINTCLTDKGLYTAKVNNIERHACLHIKEYFTKNLQSIECIEGETAEFICEVIEDSLPARWLKNEQMLECEYDYGKYETLQVGKNNRLSIKNCDLYDEGDYTVDINNRVRTASLSVIEYFTKNMDETIKCVEGDTVELSFEVIDASVAALWEKDGGVIQQSAKYEIKHQGLLHTLSIINVNLHDSGNYKILIANRMRFTSMQVKEYFTKNMETIYECIEGDRVELSCEVLKPHASALWEKDGVSVQSDAKYEIKHQGVVHTLSIVKAVLHDSGNYKVTIANCMRCTTLQVKELPLNIRQLSEEDKALYLDIIRSETETRYFIRILIIGENGVGKTCLMRRLLGETIEDVESTDCVDIVHRCKIKLQDGQWIPNKDTNKRKELLVRINRAVKAKINDNFNLEHVENSPNGTSNESEDSSSSISDESRDRSSRISGESEDCSSSISDESEDSRSNISDESEESGSSIYDEYKEFPISFLEPDETRLSLKWNNKDYRRTNVNRPLDQTKLIVSLTPNTNDKSKRNIDSISSSITALTRPDANQFTISESQPELTLENVLTESIVNELSQFINDIENYGIPNEVFVDCGFWDFAGQRHYYPTHPIFLNPNAVHLLVADVMKDIKKINTEDGYDTIGQYIDFWLDSIHSCRELSEVSDADYLNPPVILVCTGIDKCQEKLEDRKNNFCEQLMSMLKNEDKQKHLRRICYVSNTEPLKEDFDHLRQSIFEFGKKIKIFGEKLPLRWIRLERALDFVREAGVNTLSWPDINALSAKCSIDNEKEITLFLKYQHNIGSIIYFESLKGHIILNQNWLADAIGCLVSSHNYENDLKLTKEWQELLDKGELKYSFIIKLFEKDRERKFYKHENHLIKVMEMFGIIVKLKTLEEDEQNQSVPTYYMPCMISKKVSITKLYDMFGVNNDNCTLTPWLCIQFDFMPFDFFNHIFSYYVGTYSVCTEAFSGRIAIYHGMGVFFFDKFSKFVLCFSKNTIAVQIWQWKRLERGKCKLMLEELKRIVDNVKVKYESRRVSFTVKIKCAHGNIHNDAGRLSYREIESFESTEYLCEEHQQLHDINDSFQTWFEDYSEAEDFELTTVEEIDDQRLNQQFHVCNQEQSVSWCHGCSRSTCTECEMQHNDHLYEIVRNGSYPIYDVARINDIKVLRDGIIIIADYIYEKLVIWNKTEPHLYTEILLSVNPWSMAVIDKNKVAVIVDTQLLRFLFDTVMIINVDAKNEPVIKRIDVGVECKGIVHMDNHLLVSCIDRTIKKIDMSGNVADTILLRVVPGYMCVDDAGHIFFTDKDTVNCIDTVGNIVFTFTNPNATGPLLTTTDDEGHVLVACDKSNNVLRISPDGKHSLVIINHMPRSRAWAHICFDSSSKSIIIGRQAKVYFYKNYK